MNHDRRTLAAPRRARRWTPLLSGVLIVGLAIVTGCDDIYDNPDAAAASIEEAKNRLDPWTPDRDFTGDPHVDSCVLDYEAPEGSFPEDGGIATGLSDPDSPGQGWAAVWVLPDAETAAGYADDAIAEYDAGNCPERYAYPAGSGGEVHMEYSTDVAEGWHGLSTTTIGYVGDDSTQWPTASKHVIASRGVLFVKVAWSRTGEETTNVPPPAEWLDPADPYLRQVLAALGGDPDLEPPSEPDPDS